MKKTIKAPATREECWTLINEASAAGLTLDAYILPTIHRHAHAIAVLHAKMRDTEYPAPPPENAPVSRAQHYQRICATLAKIDNESRARYHEARALSRLSGDMCRYAIRLVNRAIGDAVDNARFAAIIAKPTQDRDEAESRARAAMPEPEETANDDTDEAIGIREAMRHMETASSAIFRSYIHNKNQLLGIARQYRAMARKNTPAAVRYEAKKQARFDARQNEITGGWYGKLMGDTITPAKVSA